MSNDSKNNANDQQASKRDVKVTELVANNGILKGKKTDIQNTSISSIFSVRNSNADRNKSEITVFSTQYFV